MYLFRFYSGTSKEKQTKANHDKCTAYLDFQFNISSDPQINYTSVAVASNASRISKYWGRQLAQFISEDFAVPIGGNNGILIGGENGKNELDLIYTRYSCSAPVYLESITCYLDKRQKFTIPTCPQSCKKYLFYFPQWRFFCSNCQLLYIRRV